MDNKQAIELLEHLAWDKDNEGNCYGEALQMAIDTLKQPEIITCGECIYRCVVGGKNLRFNRCALDHNSIQSDDWYCADAERRTDE